MYKDYVCNTSIYRYVQNSPNRYMQYYKGTYCYLCMIEGEYI